MNKRKLQETWDTFVMLFTIWAGLSFLSWLFLGGDPVGSMAGAFALMVVIAMFMLGGGS